LLGVLLFSFQIYGDFSGYSDIAIGVARLFGFKLMKNFAFPYFSRNIGEFWRRWHISLSTWFRDYLYIPIGGSRGSRLQQLRNIFVVFLVSGFWHGANWTFLCWGAVHALFFVPLVLLKRNRIYLNTVETRWLFPSFKEGALILFTFLITSLAWVFFRAESVGDAFIYFDGMWSNSLFSMPEMFQNIKLKLVSAFILVFVLMEWIGRNEEFAIATTTQRWAKPLQYGFYYGLAMIIFMFKGSQQDFIYFQF
jgi:D-alanyl-lipoteichoic acid acyltransferase DltB (MBOAT superfamily)